MKEPGPRSKQSQSIHIRYKAELILCRILKGEIRVLTQQRGSSSGRGRRRAFRQLLALPRPERRAEVDGRGPRQGRRRSGSPRGASEPGRGLQPPPRPPRAPLLTPAASARAPGTRSPGGAAAAPAPWLPLGAQQRRAAPPPRPCPGVGGGRGPAGMPRAATALALDRSTLNFSSLSDRLV